MKKMLFIIVIFVVTFYIYFLNINKKTYYLSLGDYLSYGINNFKKVENSYSNNLFDLYKNNLENYVNYSTIDDYRVMDLINDINYNKDVSYNNKNYKLQNLLIKSNVITISIGMNDLIYMSENIDYEYVDDLLYDIEDLLNTIRKYNKDRVYFLGFYNIINNENIIEYANKKLSSICEKNDIYFIDISNLDTYINKSKYPTNDGYVYITDQIINFTK